MVGSLWLLCTIAAVSANQSCNVYLDSCVRTVMSMFGGSVVPLWQVWRRIVDMGAAAPTVVAPQVASVQARVVALNALTKTQLAALLLADWGATVNPNDFTKDELIQQVLAFEGRWVEVGYGI
jgi:hypothetical protein